MDSKVCSTEQLANRIWLGRAARIVAIDETLVAECKLGNQGGKPLDQEWVLGAWNLTPTSLYAPSAY